MITLFHSIWTTLMFILFVGIVVWAFSRRQKTEFATAASIPFEDEEHPIQSDPDAERPYG
ncbi:MAG: cbb3-type cytochrome c oxidase subunit 3 [Proteobacteria bacterium]|jgi:cytochrome c oxidase cbb3-type subunit IV|nr:cbb3-type cytochrome c oxidase subunit 3 [Pseudomonadota bacterium]MBT5227878.1 cbb3-type cytochrome c oxidase subunit 3 [Pseudomonadota bacterium]MBT5817450.1 cbb3-type cytochrome c oxidase subunit 3 [Pseudomonadota bacterium]MBT6348479.1 cbb3-type cytochrome c oxidase subunit 3 [Pseudomonadota bacterium]